jgi:hypothetical protein
MANSPPSAKERLQVQLVAHQMNVEIPPGHESKRVAPDYVRLAVPGKHRAQTDAEPIRFARWLIWREAYPK